MKILQIIYHEKFQESEELESQNQILKSEIQKLEYEKRHLMEVLTSHDPALAQRLKASSVTLNASKSDAGTHFYQTTGSVPGTTRDQYDKTILPQLLSIVKLWVKFWRLNGFGSDTVRPDWAIFENS